MEIIIKVFVSFFTYFVLGVFGALAFGAPVSKDKNEKMVRLKQNVIFLVVLVIALYFIWTY